jgi:hypothetical protein
MPNCKTISILLMAVLCWSSLAHADTVNLKNGGSVSGIIEKEDDKTVKVNTGFGTVTFKKAEIKDIEKSSVEESGKLSRKWEEERKKLVSKGKEFEEARDKRFDLAYENSMDDAKAKKLGERQVTKQINIVREPGGKGIIVEVLLNNSVKVNLVLDTGASIIALSRKAGIELGIDLSDTKKDIMEMRLADGSKTMARAVKSVMAAIMLDQVPTIGVTEGLLGMSFLSKFNLKTDLKSMKMSLEKIEQ